MARTRTPSRQTIAVVLALAEDSASWNYGYDLCRSLNIKAGTIYPILIRLAERGHVETAWEEDPPTGRPARHLYRLSAKGVELAAELHRSETAAVRMLSPSPSLGGTAE